MGRDPRERAGSAVRTTTAVLAGTGLGVAAAVGGIALARPSTPAPTGGQAPGIRTEAPAQTGDADDRQGRTEPDQQGGQDPRDGLDQRSGRDQQGAAITPGQGPALGRSHGS